MRESYRELQDRFTQKYNDLYYPEGFTEEGNPKSFWKIIDSLHAGVNYARNCMEFYLKKKHYEDDFTLCEYYAKVLDTYLRTVHELNLGILFVSDCAVKNIWSERNPMIVENADDYIYTPTPNSENKDPLPSTAEQTTRKPDDKFLRSNAIIEVHTKCEGEIVSSLPILIGSWCELNNLNKAAMPHIVSKLFHSMYEALESLDFRKED